MAELSVTLEKIGAAAFEATAGSGGVTVIDGSPAIGGEGRGMRPTEALLTALASCAAMDVVHILRRQKEPLEGLTVEITGERTEETPSRFERMHVRFVARGAVSQKKLDRAVSLSVEKYCTVRNTLDPAVAITHEGVLAT